MSWLAYEILTVRPDMTQPPRSGVYDERVEAAAPEAQGFAAWPGRTDRVAAFTFQTFTPSEWRQLREFFDRQAGRAKAFFLPSWRRDFELASDSPAGATIIAVEGHWHTDTIEDARPDTIGRVIQITNQAGQSSVHWVEAIAAAGANDHLQIQPPLANQLESGRTVVSICYLSRLAGDTIDSDHRSIGHSRTELTFREISHRRNVNQQESAEGEAIGSLEPSFDIIATDEDPIYHNTRQTEAIGPLSYGASQTENFATEWFAAVEGNAIVLRGPAGLEFASAVYDGSEPPNHISLAFDAASREVLAWDREDGTSRVGFRDGGGDFARVTFPGQMPCLYNTFAIDSTVDAGTATLAVFYLKPGDATIYVRLASESFATERRYLNSPLAPLAIYRAVREEGRLELVGMDTGHRRARWRSDTYVTPPAVQVLYAATEMAIAGEYRPTVVFGSAESTLLQPVELGLAGEYRPTRVEAEAETEPLPFRFDIELGGVYRPTRIEGAIDDTVAQTPANFTVGGTYVLVRKIGVLEEPEGPKVDAIALAGSYTAV